MESKTMKGRNEPMVGVGDCIIGISNEGLGAHPLNPDGSSMERDVPMLFAWTKRRSNFPTGPVEFWAEDEDGEHFYPNGKIAYDEDGARDLMKEVRGGDVIIVLNADFFVKMLAAGPAAKPKKKLAATPAAKPKKQLAPTSTARSKKAVVKRAKR